MLNQKHVFAGLGNSAADIAVELSHHASRVYVSTRRGAWVTTRVARGGLPFDYWSNCRFIKDLPFVLQQWIFLRKFYKLDINYKHLGLLPETGYFSGATITNDELTNRIPTGTLLIKPNIDHFSANGVAFTDGTRVEGLEAVICCTGYNMDLKFIDDDIISLESNELRCYKFVFPTDHSRHTLAFIGFLHIAGAMNPTVEMQCRWATRVFKGLARLPSNDVMKDDVSRMYQQLESQFGYKSQRFSLNVSPNLRQCKKEAELEYISVLNPRSLEMGGGVGVGGKIDPFAFFGFKFLLIDRLSKALVQLFFNC